MTALAEAARVPRQRGFWGGTLRRFLRHPRSVVATLVLVAIVAGCLLVPAVSPHDPYAVEFADKLRGPERAHVLGTDQFGRDLLERLAVGGRATLAVAAAALAVIFVLALVYGGVAGLAGGRVDAVMMRVLDGLLAVPRFPVVVIILVIAGLRTNALTLVLALSVTSWMVSARLIRSQIVALRERSFVRAAEALGARRHQILLRHLVPNCVGVAVIAVFLELPVVILNEAFVSALGLGLNAPAATWGNLAYDGIRTGRLWEVFLPSAAIAAFAIAANLVLDGLDDAFDPRRGAR